MARPREPVALIEFKGKSHFSKDEMAARAAAEVHSATDEVAPPAGLTKKQAAHFEKLARQLLKIKILGETDCETLARYVVAEELYQAAYKDLLKAERCRPSAPEPEVQMAYLQMLEGYDRRLDRYFKQATALARDLGLTISSRCKLVVPRADEADKPRNKFESLQEAEG